MRTEDTYEIHYVYKDHLGSWTTITDAGGQVIAEQSFDAWGNLRNPATWSGSFSGKPMFDRGFTGHEHFYAFGLINMNGRMYDPQMSSFLSVDAYVQSPDNSQSFNRYAYCLNNPLKYTDPSGWQMVGGTTPSNPFHDNWGVNFAEKTYTTVEVKQMLWSMGVSTENWMEGSEMCGASGEGASGNGSGDDDKNKKKNGDNMQRTKDAVNYTNGVATLVSGAAEMVSDGKDIFGKIASKARIIGVAGILLEFESNYEKYKKGEITPYSLTARTINSGGELGLTAIPYGIGPTISIIVTAIDIGGGFDNNIYNEEWVLGVLNGIGELFQPVHQTHEQSITIYYKRGR